MRFRYRGLQIAGATPYYCKEVLTFGNVASERSPFGGKLPHTIVTYCTTP